MERHRSSVVVAINNAVGVGLDETRYMKLKFSRGFVPIQRKFANDLENLEKLGKLYDL